MSSVQDSVIVVTAESHGVTVHHQAIPEVRADGRTPREAAALLANKLAAAMDTALTEWRRQSLTKAITDVDDYVKQQA